MLNGKEVSAIRLREALEFLNQKLEKHKSTTKMYLVGSGALILGYGLDRLTGDLDCILKKGNRRLVQTIVEQLSEDLNLPEDWLNFQFEIFNDTDLKSSWFQPLLNLSYLEIQIPNLKLAMTLKCSDARETGFREKDLKDIAFCVQKLEIHNLDQFYDVTDQFEILNTLTDFESYKLEHFLKSRF